MHAEAATQKLYELETRLQGLASFAVAFSGGVDSSFLLAVAKKIRPKKLLAVTVSSEFVPSREIEAAKKTASVLKVDHICLSADILGNEEVVRNTEERCYHCKKQIFSLIRSAADDLGIKALLHGVNLDDLKDFRPGLKAADELGFLSPLAEIGFTKKMIRENSRLLGLQTWNKPSQSCLATRIPYHVRIQKPDLVRVDRSEAFLRKLGFAQVRVRCHGKTAVLEVEPDLIKMALEEDVRQKIDRTLEGFGFKTIIIDKNGYKTGKINREMFRKP
jgi:uncharacterized protein